MWADEDNTQEYTPKVETKLGPPKGPPRRPRTATGTLDSFFDDEWTNQRNLESSWSDLGSARSHRTKVRWPIAFLTEVGLEMKRVVWPRLNEIKIISLIVVTLVVFLAVYLFVVDYLYALIGKALSIGG